MKGRVTTILVVLALLATVGASAALAGTNRNYTAHLSGGNEVPTNESQAQGQVIFNVSKDGTSIDYKLIVANLDNPVAAHIHCALPGVNGPVAVNLFTGGAPGSGRFDGELAAGTIAAPNAGNACGWTTVADVVSAFDEGRAYVNVHTNDGVAPTNTGPGDLATGEIRGQVR